MRKYAIINDKVAKIGMLKAVFKDISEFSLVMVSSV